MVLKETGKRSFNEVDSRRLKEEEIHAKFLEETNNSPQFIRKSVVNPMQNLITFTLKLGKMILNVV